MTDYTTEQTTNEIPYGYCQCGCGQKTSLAPCTNKNKSWRKGEPLRFVFGHYARTQSGPRRNVVQRFWENVNEREHDECWLWTGRTNVGGYGIFTVGRRDFKAHRMSWELTNGPIPNGMKICHDCDNPPCCNPAHLFVGTQADNVADMMAKGRHVYVRMFGESHPSAKITAEQARSICQLVAQGDHKEDVAARFGITRGNVNHIVFRRSWKSLE